MNILVAGGAGFIGSHLCERLLWQNNNVVCLDNLYTGNRDNVEEFRSGNDFKFINHDITEQISEATLAQIGKIDQIYNLACPASPVHYQRDPVYTFRTSVIGISNLLDLSKKTGARLLQASTSEVYGDPLVHPQTESYWGNVNPIGPRSCYDEGKRAAETLCMDHHRQYGTKVRIARIFNTYGPKMAIDDGRVVSNFIVSALRGEPITIYGDGNQTRSFCYVSDLVSGLIRLMDSSYTGPINLGNPSEFTINALAEKVIELAGCRAGITHHPLPTDDPRQRKPDISLAENLLRWHPIVPLEEGLEQTIAYFKSVI